MSVLFQYQEIFITVTRGAALFFMHMIASAMHVFIEHRQLISLSSTFRQSEGLLIPTSRCYSAPHLGISPDSSKETQGVLYSGPEHQATLIHSILITPSLTNSLYSTLVTWDSQLFSSGRIRWENKQVPRAQSVSHARSLHTHVEKGAQGNSHLLFHDSSWKSLFTSHQISD